MKDLEDFESDDSDKKEQEPILFKYETNGNNSDPGNHENEDDSAYEQDANHPLKEVESPSALIKRADSSPPSLHNARSNSGAKPTTTVTAKMTRQSISMHGGPQLRLCKSR